MTISSSSVVRRKEDVLSSIIDQDTVLMSIDAGSYFSLDSVGGVIWSRLENEVRVDQLQDDLVASFQGDPATIRREVLEYLQRLDAHSLLEVRPEA